MYTVRYGVGDNLDIFSVCTSDIFMFFLVRGESNLKSFNLYLTHLYIFSVTPGLAVEPGKRFRSVLVSGTHASDPQPQTGVNKAKTNYNHTV